MNIIDAESEVKNILIELYSIKPSKISSNTDIFKDLGIDGDDAIDFFEFIADKFGVDFTGIEWGRHFGPEAGFNPLALLSSSWRKWHSDRIPVTVHDLAKAVVDRCWTLGY